MLYRLLLLALLLCACRQAVAQTDSTHVTWWDKKKASGLYPNRLKMIAGGESVFMVGTTIGLASLWYKDYPKQPFTWFNDNKSWFLIDKVGHATTTYYTGRLNIRLLRHAGVPEKWAVWAGGLTGWAYMAGIEYLDGRSKGWGASPGDLISNSFGSGLAIAQELAWKEQRISFKWSYFPTRFAQYRPDILGENFAQRSLKDYNGHTYWLSANLASFTSGRMPKWLNIAVGYGATGMFSSDYNPGTDLRGNLLPRVARYRQWYISPDIELSKLPIKSKLLKTVVTALGFFKFPMPALEINSRHKLKWHWLHF